MAANKYPPGIPGCFKAYDVRGAFPDSVSEELAFALGNGFAPVFGTRKAVVGRDARLSSPMLRDALVAGMIRAGTRVYDLGLCGTEEIYFTAANCDVDVGVMITASHNPANENGFKIVARGAVPVSEENGLAALAARVANGGEYARPGGSVHKISTRQQYLDWLLSRIDFPDDGRVTRAAVNAGNGCAGPLLLELEKRLPVEFIKILFEPDGAFPHGAPNPLLPERRRETAEKTRAEKADLGAAFDGDFDRCFFFDQNGNFIDGYYIVGLLAAEELRSRPGEKIIHDPRLYWNTVDVATAAGGVPVASRTGHAFMKERMRREGAIYGGEMSGHHYFRDFAYCDSGMLTFLRVLSFARRSQKPLDEFLTERTRLYPCSGEINYAVADPDAVMEKIWRIYKGESASADRVDGINLEFKKWRFNLRESNTESLLRLNVESRGDRDLVLEKTAELEKYILS